MSEVSGGLLMTCRPVDMMQVDIASVVRTVAATGFTAETKGEPLPSIQGVVDEANRLGGYYLIGHTVRCLELARRRGFTDLVQVLDSAMVSWWQRFEQPKAAPLPRLQGGRKTLAAA